MITKAIATTIRMDTIMHHVREKNADGTPVRCRVNGKCKTWKRDPSRFRLPVKHGLRTCFYIEDGFNDRDWIVPA